MPAVGRNEDAIRSYIRQKEKKDAWLDQLNVWCGTTFRWSRSRCRTSVPEQPLRAAHLVMPRLCRGILTSWGESLRALVGMRVRWRGCDPGRNMGTSPRERSRLVI